MIDDITSSLISAISVVPALAGRVGTTLGGGEADPTLSAIETPAAWVVFESAQDNSGTDGRTASDGKYQRLLMTYRVVVVLQYGEGEADLKTQLQTLEDVATAVRGQQPLDFGASPWSFQGMSLLAIETDRISYQLTFQTLGHFKLST
jgi:hypothetical protein